MIPKRWQRSRKAGDKQPASCRYVGRGTKYGNKNKVVMKDGISKWDAHKYAMWAYCSDAQTWMSKDPAYFDDLLNYEYISCFCPLDMPCHCDAIIHYLKDRAALKGETK